MTPVRWTPEADAALAEAYSAGVPIEGVLDAVSDATGGAYRPTAHAAMVRACKIGVHRPPHVSVRDRPADDHMRWRWSKDPEMVAWMLENDGGRPIAEVSDDFMARFGLRLSRGQISGFRSAHGTQSREGRGGGRDRCEVGAIRVRSGRAYVKVAADPSVPCSKDNWRPAAAVAWERANGRPVPEGSVVLTVDRDPTNLDPDNLVLVDSRTLGPMNSGRLGWHDRDGMEVAAASALLSVLANDRERELPRRCGVCGREFVPAETGSGRGTKTCPECLASGRKSMARRERRRKQ